MSDLLNRQLSLIRESAINYRGGVIDLDALVRRVEALGNIIGGPLWEESLFPIVVELEGINSELIDKNRSTTPAEDAVLKGLLKRLDEIADPPS